MKKIFLTFLIILLIGVNSNFTYSFEGKNEFQTINYLIKYTDTKIGDIEKISIKYNLVKDERLKEKIENLKNIKNILIKTQKTGKYNTYLSKIIEELKQNNNEIKKYIKKKISEKKSEAKKYSIIYLKRIKLILNKIDTIVVNITLKLKEKAKLNYKDKQILNILYRIKQKLYSLKKITNKNFNTKRDLQNYIISNFNQIKNQFNQIKIIIRK